jgi:hypothetical protein
MSSPRPKLSSSRLGTAGGGRADDYVVPLDDVHRAEGDPFTGRVGPLEDVDRDLQRVLLVLHALKCGTDSVVLPPIARHLGPRADAPALRACLSARVYCRCFECHCAAIEFTVSKPTELRHQGNPPNKTSHR